MLKPTRERPGPRRAPDEPMRATLARSLRLLHLFRFEQTDPSRFYTAMAQDVVAQVGGYASLDDAVVVDVGSGRGYFRDAFERAGSRYVGIDIDLDELVVEAVAGRSGATSAVVAGDGAALPLRSDAVDVCCSLNVLEHTSVPWDFADEMVRVTRPRGIVLISYTSWWGPWGGHETSPWHYLGGHRARRRYEHRRGTPPKNVYGSSLFAVTTAAGLRWARSQEERGLAEVVDVFPRYHPRWSHWVLRVPVLRELVTWNLTIVLRPW